MKELIYYTYLNSRKFIHSKALIIFQTTKLFSNENRKKFILIVFVVCYVSFKITSF